MTLRPFLLTLSLAATLGLAQTDAPKSVGTLTVTTIDCLEDLSSLPQLSYLKMNDRNLAHGFLHGPTTMSTPGKAVGRRIAPGVSRFTLTLLAGNYEIYGRSAGCPNGQVMAVVLAGSSRSTSLVLGGFWSMAFDHDHAGLAGMLRMPVARLELVGEGGGSDTRFVDVENGAFYADSLQRAKWTLRIWVDCCRHANFPIDLSGVRPGDYVTVALSAADVLGRLGYTGTLFSNPAFVAGSSSGTWFTNDGRDTVGIAKLDGTHREFSLPRGHSPHFIVSDGKQGAWFSEAGGFVGHAGPLGDITEVALSSAGDRRTPRIERLLPQSDGSLLVTAAYPSRLFRISADRRVSEIAVPADVKLYEAAVGEDGTVWFNVNDAADLARVSGSTIVVERAASKKLAPDLTRANLAFYSLRQGAKASVLLATFQESGGGLSAETATAVSDRRGGVWLLDCFHDSVRHVNMSGIERHFDTPGCPEKGISDGDGGVWFVADRLQTLWHIGAGNTATNYRLPSQTATPGNLTLDGQGVLWFPEHGLNRIAFLRDGHFGEIDLGNPGATPHLTIVP
ncbi:MAG: hypothetical protein WA668_06660 [Candidatus Cybelea sp.]